MSANAVKQLPYSKKDYITYRTDGRLGLLVKYSTPNVLIVFALAALILSACFALLWASSFALGAGAAIAGFLFTSAIKLHSEMRDRAFSFLESSRENALYRKSINGTLRHFAKHGELSAADCQRYFAKGIKPEKFQERLRTTCNFFEELAIAIQSKEIHEPLVCDYFMGMFIGIYEKIDQHFLPYTRGLSEDSPHKNEKQEPTRLNVFENMDWLYLRWKPILSEMNRRMLNYYREIHHCDTENSGTGSPSSPPLPPTQSPAKQNADAQDCAALLQKYPDIYHRALAEMQRRKKQDSLYD